MCELMKFYNVIINKKYGSFSFCDIAYILDPKDSY